MTSMGDESDSLEPKSPEPRLKNDPLSSIDTKNEVSIMNEFGYMVPKESHINRKVANLPNGVIKGKEFIVDDMDLAEY
jgi:hypothetical protein